MEFVDSNISFSILPESARWMMSRRDYTKAEKLLKDNAKINKRSFDQEAFERLRNEHEQVFHFYSITFFLEIVFLRSIRIH